jgi:hypothetical protein
LSIDEEIQSFYNASETTGWIAQGRWVTYLINVLLFPHSLMPYFPTLIAILCIAVSAVLITSSFGGTLTSKLVFSTVFISIPSHAYYLAFNTFNAAVGIGMLMVVFSYIFFRKAVEQRDLNVFYLVLSSVILGLATGVYQSTVTIFLSLVSAFILTLLINEKEKDRKIYLLIIAYAFVILLFSLLFYKLGDYLFKTYFVTRKDLHNSEFIDSYWGWNKDSKANILITIFNSIVNYFNGNGFYGGYTMKSLFLVIPIILYHIVFRTEGLFRKTLTIFILIIFIFSPFVFMFITGSPLETRTLLALPLLAGGLWWIAIEKSGMIIKRILLIVAAFIFINNVYSTTRLFYSGNVVVQADRDMANSISERINSLEVNENSSKIPVAFIGRYQYESNELFFLNDVFGASFFYWDNGNPDRMVLFMRTLGISNIVVADKEQYDKALKICPDMPKWPKKGSVIFFDNFVIVKLSDP